MKNVMRVLAAVTRLAEPTPAHVLAHTGLSEVALTRALNTLSNEFGVYVEPVSRRTVTVYQISDWGVFETGTAIQPYLNKIVLMNTQPLVQFADKHAYCEHVKMSNFKQSMRLEGYDITVPEHVITPRQRDDLRQQLIRRYKQADTEKV